MSYNYCNYNFQSKFAYIENKCITISDYITNYINNNKKCKIKCNKGHELVCVNGKKNQQHFRHKNNEDLGGHPMTDWHCEWQSNFSNTEIHIPKINNKQIKDRIADVLIKEYNIVIEFQHSIIDKQEIFSRKNDYELNNYKIIWIIDGNNSILVKNLDYSNRIFLEFISNNWKFESFAHYELIFIDINGLIYKISPNNVKSNMIDVEKPIEKKKFIELLNSNDNVIHNIDIPYQCNLYIKQQGAGNGKTYGLIQMLESKEFEHYKYFIIVTKQHSAKYIIYNEFKEQIKNGHLKYLVIEDEKDEQKKYKIIYTNKKTNSKCEIVVSTIDSLIYKLGNQNHNELDKFEGLVNSIVDGYIEKNNTNIKLNKEVCLICDETQDLPINYAKAIIQIMRNKYIDAYIVGDKLQSIMNQDNSFTYLMNNDFPYISKISFQSTNICRRFYDQELVNFVNTIVPFDKYSLPNINPYKIEKDYNNSVNIFTGLNIYSNEEDENKINNEVEKIMELYDKEVIENNYKPNDFLFITPFTKNNPLLNAIEIAISIYWNKKYEKENFERYAIFHRSEEGNSINLSESENATRIVSIHTSKGDGRNIIFVIGLDEKSLIRFSYEKNNLIYDSLIHVALTRMKKKIYLRIIENNDDICQKISKYTHDNNMNLKIKPNLLINNKIKYNEIVDNLKTNEDYISLKNIIIKESNILQFPKLDEKIIIDMGHHSIKYTSMMIYLYMKIIKNETKIKDDEIKKQIQAKFIKIKDSPIYSTNKWQEYNNFLKEKKIALLELSNNRENRKYYNIINEFMKKVKNKIKYIFSNEINTLCPLECIILYFMIQLCSNGIYSDITINELYNIIDIYSKSFNSEIRGHDECLCKDYFLNKTNENNTKIIKMSDYLLNHYEQINKINLIYDNFINKFPKINWLIDHNINLNGTNNDFKIYKKFQLLGYDNDNVFIVYVKPQLNDLNYNQILIDSIYDTFLISNIKKPDEYDEDKEKYNKLLKDYEKFGNKNIKTIIFTLDKDNFIIIDWNNNNENLITKYKESLIDKIKNKIIMKYSIEIKYVYYFYKYSKDKCIEQNIAPDKIIKNIINEFKNDKYFENIPEFIIKFLYKIENKLDDYRDKKEKWELLNTFDNKEYFIEKLNDKMIESIKYFLGIEDDE